MVDQFYLNSFVEELIEDLIDVSKEKKLLMRYMSKDTIRMVKKRIDYLKAAPNFQWCINNPIGNFESLIGNYQHKYSIRLDKNYRLIISPNASEYSPEALGNCTEFFIEGVVDYHGNGKNNWLIP